MIKKFSVLYVGQIELDNVGLHGTPADERRYPNERLVEAFQTSKEIAQLMDGLGFGRHVVGPDYISQAKFTPAAPE